MASSQGKTPLGILAILCALVCVGFVVFTAPQVKRAWLMHEGSTETVATVVDHVIIQNNRVLAVQEHPYLVTRHIAPDGSVHITRHRVSPAGFNATPDGHEVWLRHATMDPSVAEIVPGYTRNRAQRMVILSMLAFVASIVFLVLWRKGRP